jgi:hypothetical protein
MIGASDFGTGWKDRLTSELALGSEDFVKCVRQLIKGDRNEQKPIRQLEESMPISWQAVAKVWGEP